MIKIENTQRDNNVQFGFNINNKEVIYLMIKRPLRRLAALTCNHDQYSTKIVITFGHLVYELQYIKS